MTASTTAPPGEAGPKSDGSLKGEITLAGTPARREAAGRLKSQYDATRAGLKCD